MNKIKTQEKIQEHNSTLQTAIKEMKKQGSGSFAIYDSLTPTIEQNQSLFQNTLLPNETKQPFDKAITTIEELHKIGSPKEMINFIILEALENNDEENSEMQLH